MLNEARILKSLEHPNILKFYNYYETRNHLWVIFEFCPGGDVLSMLNEDKKLPESWVKIFALEIIRGLSYLHSNGIIYGELKPSTILFNEYSNLKLADFGKARKISDYMNPGQETNARNKSGSPYYMAPELFQDDGVYSFASDLWSLGWLLFEFLTGKLPFSSNSLNRLMKMIQDEQPPLNLLTVSKDLFNIIWLWLEKDPSKRITWEELLNNPYWGSEGKELFDALILPPEPQFDDYLLKYGKKKKIWEKGRKEELKR